MRERTVLNFKVHHSRSLKFMDLFQGRLDSSRKTVSHNMLIKSKAL